MANVQIYFVSLGSETYRVTWLLLSISECKVLFLLTVMVSVRRDSGRVCIPLSFTRGTTAICEA